MFHFQGTTTKVNINKNTENSQVIPKAAIPMRQFYFDCLEVKRQQNNGKNSKENNGKNSKENNWKNSEENNGKNSKENNEKNSKENNRKNSKENNGKNSKDFY